MRGRGKGRGEEEACGIRLDSTTRSIEHWGCRIGLVAVLPAAGKARSEGKPQKIAQKDSGLLVSTEGLMEVRRLLLYTRLGRA